MKGNALLLFDKRVKGFVRFWLAYSIVFGIWDAILAVALHDVVSLIFFVILALCFVYWFIEARRLRDQAVAAEVAKQ